MLALGASALLAIPVAVTLSLVGLPDQDMLQAAVARAESLADLLAQRSPGDRTQGQLTKTKQLRALVAPRDSSEVATAGERADRPGGTGACRSDRAAAGPGARGKSCR